MPPPASVRFRAPAAVRPRSARRWRAVHHAASAAVAVGALIAGVLIGAAGPAESPVAGSAPGHPATAAPGMPQRP